MFVFDIPRLSLLFYPFSADHGQSTKEPSSISPDADDLARADSNSSGSGGAGRAQGGGSSSTSDDSNDRQMPSTSSSFSRPTPSSSGLGGGSSGLSFDSSSKPRKNSDTGVEKSVAWSIPGTSGDSSGFHQETLSQSPQPGDSSTGLVLVDGGDNNISTIKRSPYRRLKEGVKPSGSSGSGQTTSNRVLAWAEDVPTSSTSGPSSSVFIPVQNSHQSGSMMSNNDLNEFDPFAPTTSSTSPGKWAATQLLFRVQIRTSSWL